MLLPDTEHYRLRHVFSFKHTDAIYNLVFIASQLKWSRQAECTVMVWDWPSRLSGEGSVPPELFYEREAEEGEVGHLSALNGNEAALAVLWEKHDGKENRKGNTGRSSTAITSLFIYSRNGMCDSVDIGCCR